MYPLLLKCPASRWRQPTRPHQHLHPPPSHCRHLRRCPPSLFTITKARVHCAVYMTKPKATGSDGSTSKDCGLVNTLENGIDALQAFSADGIPIEFKPGHWLVLDGVRDCDSSSCSDVVGLQQHLLDRKSTRLNSSH